jgi:hypothetical protein
MGMSHFFKSAWFSSDSALASDVAAAGVETDWLGAEAVDADGVSASKVLANAKQTKTRLNQQDADPIF